jgi:hypothetical protein
MPARKGLPYFEGRSPKCSSMAMQAYHLKATPPLNYWRPWEQAFPSSNVQKLMNKSSREVISNTYILTNIIFKKVLLKETKILQDIITL